MTTCGPCRLSTRVSDFRFRLIEFDSLYPVPCSLFAALQSLMTFPANRMRRMRRSEPLRALVRETVLDPAT